MANYPLTRLRQLLGRPAGQRGIVTRAGTTQVEVATPTGLVRAQPAAGLIVGQTVMVRDGTAYPAVRAARRYPV